MIEALSGDSTAILLDKGFTDALTSLKLTPGVVGTAELTDGSLVFPITGGNVTVFEPGQVPHYVVGQIQHEGSGLSLTAGDTTVELTNFNVDPGVSRVYGDVTVNGEVAATSAYLFELNGSTLKPLQTEGNTAILDGTTVRSPRTPPPCSTRCSRPTRSSPASWSASPRSPSTPSDALVSYPDETITRSPRKTTSAGCAVGRSLPCRLSAT